jgi:zinc protease
MTSRPEETVFESQLSNGLQVLLREDHTAPIATFWTWYRVGSRNELPGKTGISHWVEHMQFKGTPSIAKGQIFRDVSSAGGTLNALTSHDWTAYFETVPVDRLDLPLSIEPDRMVNSLYTPEEVESERTVILSERHGAENDPGYALYEETIGSAFHAHPYRHMVIGYATDLKRITREDLYSHYRRYYHPANAFVVAVGDFDAGALFARIEEAFGRIPAGEEIPRAIGIVEPPQPGERRVAMRRAAGAPYLRLGFHAPGAASPDLVPLLVAEAVLSGGQPMGFGGGGGMGRSSRLYRALVASGLARAAGSDMSITIDPYLFQIGVAALPGGNLERLEAIVDREVTRLREEPVPADELRRAIRQLEAQFVYSSEGVTNQAYWLGQWDIVDTWQRALSLPDEIRAVTAADVQRVADRYLAPERRTVGWLEPSSEGGEDEPIGEPAAAIYPVAAWGIGGPRSNARAASGEFERQLLPNGMVVLGQDRPQSRSVAVRLRLPAGSIHESADNAGIAYLTARASLRGSSGRTFEEINALTDDLGSSISVDAGRQFVEARIRCLRDDLPVMVDLLAHALREPDFPDEEIARVKAEQLGAIAEGNKDTRATADRIMRRAVYPSPNPLGRRVLGTDESVSAIDREEVARFHGRAYGPSSAVVAVVGGLGGFSSAARAIGEALGDWAGATSPVADDMEVVNTAPARRTETIPDKSQADIALGLPTISRGDPDYYALDVANLILGRLGLMGRLGAEVRDLQGLAYYVYSQLEPRSDGSLWTARAGVDPGNVGRAVESIEQGLGRLRSELVTEEELRDARNYLVGILPLALESHDGVA